MISLVCHPILCNMLKSFCSRVEETASVGALSFELLGDMVDVVVWR